MDFKEGLLIDGVTTEANAFTASTLKFKNNIITGTLTTAATLLSTTAANATTLANWYSTSNNTTVASSAGILTTPYNTTNAQIYTSLDYRPTATSIAATGADFTDSALLTNNSNDFIALEATVYPNPFATNFKLMYNAISNENVELSITDLTGRNIENKSLTYNTAENFEFGNNLTAGVYLVQIKQGQALKNIKIIKN